MSTLSIAVSGLHRGDNPQLGAGVIRSLRRVYPSAHNIGLVYDVMKTASTPNPTALCSGRNPPQ